MPSSRHYVYAAAFFLGIITTVWASCAHSGRCLHHRPRECGGINYVLVARTAKGVSRKGWGGMAR